MKLGIAQKVSLLSSSLVVLTSGLVAAVFFYFLSELSTERRYGYLTDIGDTMGQRLASEMLTVVRDTKMIAALPITRQIAEEKDLAHRRVLLDELARSLEQWIALSPAYHKMRLFDARGKELVRVDRVGERIWRVSETELQDKSHRGFIKEAMQLPPGKASMSAIDLNEEGGKLEVPHVATGRASTPIFTAAGDRFGLVVVNVAMTGIFKRLEQSTVGLAQLLISNADGDYLFHPDPGKTFGFQLGRRHTIDGEFPALADAIKERKDQAVNARQEDGEHRWLLRLVPVDLGVDGVPRLIWLALKVDHKLLTAYFVPLRNRLLIVAAALVALGLIASVFFSRRLARPIVALSRAMRTFDPESETAPLPLEPRGTDEIGALAESFDNMRGHVFSKTRKLVLANSDLKQFAYAAAHDLQEPLRKITSFSQLLKEDYGEHFKAGDGADYLDALQRSAKRMRGLIDDILTLPQVGLVDKLTPIDSGEALKQALDNLEPVIHESGAKVLAPELPVVQAHLGELSRVFQNLCGNALKFRHQGRSPVLEILAAPVGEFVQFSVRDNGIGINDAYFQRIFLAFNRLHGKDKYPGNGMGLAISRRIVEGFGGRIWVESKAGEGSVFHFTVPRVARTPAPRERSTQGVSR